MRRFIKKRNKKFKIEKSPKEKPLHLGPKPSLKEDFRILERESGLGGTRRPRRRKRTTEDSCSSLQSFFFEV